MLKVNNIFKHLKTICKHKYYVAKYCFKFGLYWQGIVHDLSKFSPTEFLTSIKYYQGNRSPINAEKEDKGYSDAWMHHYHRNKHHWMYWVDFDDYQNLVPLKIPYKYVIESIADWISAGIVYEGDKFTWSEPYEFYKDKIRIDNKTSETIFHKHTRQLYDKILLDLKNLGIDYVIHNIRNGWYKDLYENNTQLLFSLSDGISKYYVQDKLITDKGNKLIYIFLDIDGVLNNENYIDYCYENNGRHSMNMNDVPFDPNNLKNLYLLVNYLQMEGYIVQIILSSTWRLNEIDYHIVDSRLAEYGLSLYDKTKQLSSKRGIEIQDFINNHNKPCYYFILDDDIFDIKDLHPDQYVIRTSFKTGLDNTKLLECIHKFNKFQFK